MPSLLPKERALYALSHVEPDRVPIDYMANPEIDRRLKNHFGLGPDEDEALRRRLNVDFRHLKIPYTGPELHAPIPDRRIDIWGIRTRWVEHGAGGYWDYCDFPLKDADLDVIASWPMPSPDDFDYDEASRKCLDFKEYCVVAGDPGFADIINMTGMIRTMEQTLIDLMTDDPATLHLVDRRIEVQLGMLERLFDRAGDHIDLLWIGEDLGTQIGPMIGPALYDRNFRPRHQRFIDLAESYEIPVMLHSCGSSQWVFNTLVEMGVSVIDTLQPEAKEMEPDRLKSLFGDRLAFHGCISTAGPVTYGAPEEVRDNVREVLEIMKPGGGYALAPTHWLQDNSPVENVVAMYEAAMEYGNY